MLRDNVCDNCKKVIDNKEKVTAIIPNLEASTKLDSPGKMRLKLSKYSLTTRAIRVYCENCLKLNLYLEEAKEDA